MNVEGFDNGNEILSLAEVDRAAVHWYPAFWTNCQTLLRAFKAANTNGTGFIEFKDCQSLLDLLHYYNELDVLLEQLDTNGDNGISFNEFKRKHEIIGISNVHEHDLKEEFNRIDVNHG